MLHREPRAGAAEAGHHLVGDEKDVEGVAQRAHPLPVAARGDEAIVRSATVGRGDESGDGVGTLIVEAAFDLREALVDPVVDGDIVRASRLRELRHLGPVRHHRVIGAQHPWIPAQPHRRQRHAVVALEIADHLVLAGAALGDPILAGELERGLDRLRSARHEIDRRQARRRVAGNRRGELGARAVGEHRVAIGKMIELRGDGRLHARVAMPDIDRHRPARGVDVAPPGGILQPDAVSLCQLDVERVIAEHMGKIALGAKHSDQVVRSGRHGSWVLVFARLAARPSGRFREELRFPRRHGRRRGPAGRCAGRARRGSPAGVPR